MRSDAWGIAGEKKYLAAYDAIAYPGMSEKKVEELIEKKEGKEVLKGGREERVFSKSRP